MVKRPNFNNSVLLLALTLGIVLMPRVFAVIDKSSLLVDNDTFILGKSFFEKPWVAFPASTTARDGLGPLFNQNACINCHPKGGRSDKFVIKLDNPNTIYGTQINTQSIQNVPKEAVIEIHYKSSIIVYSDGQKVTLKKPVINLKNLGYGQVESALSMRISPSLHGIGLLAEIPNKPKSRFNLTADVDSILEQVAKAAHNDMGLTNPLHPQENCSENQHQCLYAPSSNKVDLPKYRLEAIAYFVKHLDNVSYVKPIKLFNKIGCDSCHTPSYVLKTQTIYPYTDLLAHDLGEGHFRTAPLWNSKKQANFWHDGRANSVEEAILWHNGEAEKHKNRFMNLSKNERHKIIQFVRQ